MISEECQGEILKTYESTFQDCLAELYRKRLGLRKSKNGDAHLIQSLLDIMESEKLDYTNTFRNLAMAVNKDHTAELSSDVANAWNNYYQIRQELEITSSEKKKKLLNENNPKFILRNYMAQEAIEAAEESDFTVIEKFIKVITNPFSELDEYQHYAEKSPAWAKDLEISCSS